MIEKLSPEAKTMLNDFLNQIDYEKGKEIERLNNRLKTSNDTCNYLRNTIDKAIEYIETYKDTQSKNVYVDFDLEDIDNLLDILRGEDKE